MATFARHSAGLFALQRTGRQSLLSVRSAATPAWSPRSVLNSSSLRRTQAFTSSAPALTPASDPPSKPPTRFQSSLAQIRALAQRHGSDPASLIASFMVLHELTALIPLLILFWLFELLGAGQSFLAWLEGDDGSAQQSADPDTQGWKNVVNGWVQEGIKRAERVGRRYGLFGIEKGSKSSATQAHDEADAALVSAPSTQLQSGALVGSFANAVAAYACVKALIPLRLAASVALAPAFARYTIEPVKRLFGRGNKRPIVPSKAAGSSQTTQSKL
ncbi:Serine--tRNA ligase, mitochondrial [Tilletia horrida]|uniref:Serine--tRNA ligase, mitochondrial n=1 Tax=Tilletia horrida TaxID=155126 RepID=A0AAN6JYR7_9BASI|nr:Serine--tRNA ligase, mitochondrial [Tilletia horrida]KAK0553228.1 Serine--tRNA ligase, mitochondrial [Tilletia horrida]KAK0565288.1 Serine--tRNA ligase, mitochondrial [Tilletia horrida]